MPISLHQRHYRFGQDNGTESTHTWYGDEDTPVTMQTGQSFLLRIAVWEEGNTAAPNTSNQFQCRRNAGAWQNITTTSTICKAVAVAAFTDAQHCTRRLTAKPTGSFENSGQGCTEDGLSGGSQNDIGANGYSETEAGLQLIGADLATGDTVEFRLVCSPVNIAVYDVTPSLTVSVASISPSRSESASPSISPSVSESVSPSLSESVSESSSPSTIATVVQVALLVLEVPGVGQYARPISPDLAAGSWTPSTGVLLYPMLDEEIADDNDYIRSGASPTDDTAKLTLTPLEWPEAGTVTLRIRGKWTEAT